MIYGASSIKVLTSCIYLYRQNERSSTHNKDISDLSFSLINHLGINLNTMINMSWVYSFYSVSRSKISILVYSVCRVIVIDFVILAII